MRHRLPSVLGRFPHRIALQPSTALGALIVAVAALALPGCVGSRYITPGGPAPIGEYTTRSVAARIAIQPEALFPATLAVARVQASGYFSYSAEGVRRGSTTMVGPQDLEADGDQDKIRAWKGLKGLARLTPIVIPAGEDDLAAFREGAASLRADILALYTLDTAFRVDDRDIGPLGLMTLGLAPTKNAVVSCTASLAYFDVRTGFCFGTVEWTERDDQLASSWTERQAVEDARRRVERAAFVGMLGEAQKAFEEIAAAGAPAKAEPAAAPSPAPTAEPGAAGGVATPRFGRRRVAPGFDGGTPSRRI